MAERAPVPSRGLVLFLRGFLGLHILALPVAGQAQDSARPGGDPAGGILRGSVTAHPDPRSRPLSGVEIELPGRDGVAGTVSDASGGFRIENVPPGPVTVSFERVGYRPLLLEIRIPPGDTATLDVELEVEPLPVMGLVVTAVPPPTPLPSLLPQQEGRHGPVEVGLRALEAAPGLAEAGLGDAVRAIGGSGSTDPARVLLMRGSTADQRLFLLDGAPVYAPFHLGGLLEPFRIDLLSSAGHFVGGAPGRYDGGLSYILDLRTRPGDHETLHGSAFLDLLGGGAALEGPVGERGSFLASARSLHDLGQPVLGATRSPFGYGEVLFRGDAEIGPGQRLTTTGFWNREEVRLRLPVAAGGDPSASRPHEARWGNEALSIRYAGGSKATEVRTTLAASRYHAGLPLDVEDLAYAAARTVRVSGLTEVGRAIGPWRLGLGVSAERIEHRSRARIVAGDSITEGHGRARTDALALYAQGERSLGPDLHFSGALRFDHFPGAGGLRVAPRGALTWALSDAADLTLSAGRFYQLPRGAELEVGVALGDPAGVTAGHGLFQPATATHVVLSLDQRLSTGVELGLDGFVKGFRDLPGVEDGVLRSSGLDLRVRRSGDDLTGWLGYSLAWFWTPGEGGPDGGSSAETAFGGTEEFAGRHLLTAGVDGRLGSGWGVQLQISWGDGLPYASVPLESGQTAVAPSTPFQTVIDQSGAADPPTDRRIPTLDGFLRLDLELSREWELTWDGRSGSLRPYLRVLNAVSNRDALFHYFDPWRSPEVQSLADRPFLPLVGAELRF